MSEQLLGWDTLGDQGLRERFDLAIAEVLSNLMDPNTDPKAAREVIVKLKFKVSEDRSVEEHTTLVTTKKAPIKPMAGSGFLERLEEGGPVIATTRTTPVQTEIEWVASNN